MRAAALAGQPTWGPLALTGPLPALTETAVSGDVISAPAISAHGVSTCGDLKYPPNFRHFAYVNPDAPKGGRIAAIDTGARSVFDSLGNYILKGDPAQRFDLLFDTPMTRAQDEPDAMYGLLAARIEYPADRSWARFSDGTPVTAEGVAFSFNILKKKGEPQIRLPLRDIERAAVLDLLRVKYMFRADAPKRDLPTAAERTLLDPLTVDLPPETFGPAILPLIAGGSGSIRKQLREAGRLPGAAGRRMADGVRRNVAGEALAVEFIDDSSAFERITGPCAVNPRKIGIKASRRTVDQAQFLRRLENFDFDIAVSRFSIPPTRGRELRVFFGSDAAKMPGSRNLSGIAGPAVDALIEVEISAKSRMELGTAVLALDRALCAGRYWVPQWNKASHSLAYWDRFGCPKAEKPPYDRAILDTWWADADKEAALTAACAE